MSGAEAAGCRLRRVSEARLTDDPLWSARFVSAVVHELRTPLSSLLLTAELLAEDPKLEPRQARFARALHEAAGDLRALVDDLGELNRVRSGRARVLPSAVVLADVLTEAEEELEPQLRERGAHWQVTIQDDAPPTVASDFAWLGRIVRQLAGSALSAGAQELRWRVAAGAGGGATVALADDGERLAEVDRATLLEPFGNATARVRRTHGGSGLGLALAGAAARLLGGSLEVGAGDGPTTLTLTLPAVVPEPAEP